MLSPNCHEKLVTLVNCLASSKTRSQMAQHKQNIKQLLEQNYQSIESATLIQQFLAYSIVNKRVASLLPYLQESTCIFAYYSQSLQEIARRYIENRQNSKIDETQAKPVRLLLARKILESQHLVNSLIATCRKDQDVCHKFIKTLAEALNEKKPTGHVTNLVVLCINIVRSKNMINSQLVKSAIQILNILIPEHQGLQNSILPVVAQLAIQLVKQDSLGAENLQTVNIFLKYCAKEQSAKVLSYISIVYEILKQKMISSCKVKCEKLILIRAPQSRKICQFLRLSLNIIGVDSNKDSSKPYGIKTYSNLSKQSMVSLCQELLLVLDSSCVHELYTILTNLSDVKNYKLYLNQCLINCAPYQFKSGQEQQIQVQIIFELLTWLQSLNTVKTNEIRKEFKLFEDNQEQPATNLFIDFIRATIQSQFQFEFSEDMVKSACSLLCYLVPAIAVRPNSKQIVIEILKMLLNLNESCEKEYRGFMVKSILRIICVYANQLLPNNHFLSEVIQYKLSADFSSQKQQLLYLAKGGYLTVKFYSELNEKVNNGDLLNFSNEQIELVFSFLVIKNKTQLESINNDWEWSAYINQVGKKVYGKQWTVPEKELKLIKETKMQKYCIEFQQDIAKIDGLLHPKRV